MQHWCSSAYVGGTVKRCLDSMVGLLIAGTLLCACDPSATATREWTPADHGQPPGASGDGRAAPAPAQEEGGEARAAKALWGVSCAGCHGASGRGDGPTPPPGANVPDLTKPEIQQAYSDERMTEVIREGNGLMPAFGTKLSPKAIAALVGHIRTLAQGDSAAPSTPALPSGHP